MASAVLRIACTVSVFGAFAATPGHAQAPAPVSRAQVVAAALAGHPTLVSARRGLGTHEANLVGARQLLRDNPVLAAEGGFEPGDTSDRRVALTINQPVDLAGARGLRIDHAALGLQAGQAQVRAAELQVAFAASAAWWQAWRAARLLEVTRQVHEIARTLQHAAEQRFRAGDIAELDRNFVDIEVARAQAAVAQAEAEAATAAAELARAAGWPAGTRPVVGDEPLPALPGDDEASWQAVARRERPDLAASRLQAQAGQAAVRLRRREAWPVPSFGLGFEHEALTVEGPATGGGTARIAHASTQLLLQLELPLPVWDRNQGEILGALAAQRVADAELRLVEARVHAEVAAAWQGVHATRKAADAYAGALPRIERNLALLEQAFGAGQVDLGQTLAARDRAVAARREAIQVVVDHARAIDALRFAAGQLPATTGPSAAGGPP